MIWQAEMQ